jgi:sodium-independent sulfate anion transporter 11
LILIVQIYFSEIDLIPAFATFFSCLFWALEWGILVGVGIQVLVNLHHVARPVVNVDLKKLIGFKDSEKGQFLFVTLDRALIIPSISYVR